MARTAGSKNRSTAPESYEQALKMARIRAVDAAPIWGLDPKTIGRKCCRGDIVGAVKLGQVWYVTARGMDRLFGKR